MPKTMTNGATERSHAKRGAMAAWRRALKSREVSLEALFDERPECLGHVPLIELVRLGARWGTKRAAVLNEWAVDEGLNLAVPLEDAPERVLRWLRGAVREESTRRRTPRVVAPPEPEKPKRPQPPKPRNCAYLLPAGPFRRWLQAEVERERRGVEHECPQIVNHWSAHSLNREVLSRVSRRLGIAPKTLYEHLNGNAKEVHISTVDRIVGPLVLNELYPVE